MSGAPISLDSEIFAERAVLEKLFNIAKAPDSAGAPHLFTTHVLDAQNVGCKYVRGTSGIPSLGNVRQFFQNCPFGENLCTHAYRGTGHGSLPPGL